MNFSAPKRIQDASDSDRFEALFAQHHAAVLGFALRRSSSPEDAADALADTFAIAWRKIDDAPLGDAARWWLYSIARHSISNARRSEQRRDALASVVAHELSTAFARYGFGVDSISEDVATALAQLAEHEREILLLHAWEELKPRELAAVLGIGRATARTRLHRARKSFMAALDSNELHAVADALPIPREELT